MHDYLYRNILELDAAGAVAPAQKEKYAMSYGNYGGGSRRYDSRPREMHKIKCSDCGNESEVPFKPTEGRPVYCQECFQKHKPPRRDRF
jgi:CxxC-x17-CxxC domain-containing protein